MEISNRTVQVQVQVQVQKSTTNSKQQTINVIPETKLKTMKFNIQHPFYLIISAVIFTSCYNQERNCKDYKLGKFSFEQEIEGKLETSVFERNDSIQIETFRGKTDSSSVRWVNDCEFILQNLKPKNREEKKGIHIKILTTTADSYTFEYSFVGDTNKQKGTAKRVQ